MLNNLPIPPPPPRRKVKASQVIPVVILVVSVIGALYFSGFFDDTHVLTPTNTPVMTPTNTPVIARMCVPKFVIS